MASCASNRLNTAKIQEKKKNFPALGCRRLWEIAEEIWGSETTRGFGKLGLLLINPKYLFPPQS